MKMKGTYNRLLSLLLGLLFYTAFGQVSVPSQIENEPGYTEVFPPTTQLTVLDSLVQLKEQIVLHIDKLKLRPKDQLFFKAYILTGPEHLSISKSQVLNIELLTEDGSLVNKQYHRIVDGKSNGSIEIPDRIDDGNYYVRAYTRWMLNYGPEYLPAKKIEVVGGRKKRKVRPEDHQEIMIYPEGGKMVAGLSQHVVVTFQNKDLSELPIIDGNGIEQTTIKKFNKNLGTFKIKPIKGEHYFIKLNENQKIQLPEIQEYGYSLQVNNLEEDKIFLRVEASPELKDNTIYLEGVVNSTTLFETKVHLEANRIAQIEIPKINFPSGLLELRLRDQLDQVWARRPVYINQEELQITAQKQSRSDGTETLKFRVTNRAGRPLKTELSVSLQGITDAGSDAHSTYFEAKEDVSKRNQRFINDLLVLTESPTDKLTADSNMKFPDQIRYKFQNGLDFYGQAYDLNNSLLPNCKIQILITTANNVHVLETETNMDGLFSISGLEIIGESKMIFRTSGDETKTKLVKVIPYTFEIPPLYKGNKSQLRNELAEESLREMARKPMVNFNSKVGIEKLIELDEITLIASKQIQKYSPSLYNLSATRVINQNPERPKTIPQLFLNVPGVQVRGLGTLNPSISIPRAALYGPLLWVVDGFPLMQSTNLVDIITMVSYPDVERIELLIGGEASIYGSRAAGGVILIYTRNGSDMDFIARKDAELNFQGFHQSIDFNEYLNSKTLENNDDVQVPTTYYWNPELITNEKGEAELNLNNLNESYKFWINAKAVNEKGAIGELRTFFN